MLRRGRGGGRASGGAGDAGMKAVPEGEGDEDDEGRQRDGHHALGSAADGYGSAKIRPEAEMATMASLSRKPRYPEVSAGAMWERYRTKVVG